MPDDPLFIPEFMLYAKSSLLWFKITTELREFRNYLFFVVFLLRFPSLEILCPKFLIVDLMN